MNKTLGTGLSNVFAELSEEKEGGGERGRLNTWLEIRYYFAEIFIQQKAVLCCAVHPSMNIL